MDFRLGIKKECRRLRVGSVPRRRSEPDEEAMASSSWTLQAQVEVSAVVTSLMIYERPRKLMPQSTAGDASGTLSLVEKRSCWDVGPDVGSISSTGGDSGGQLAGWRSTGRMGNPGHVGKGHRTGAQKCENAEINAEMRVRRLVWLVFVLSPLVILAPSNSVPARSEGVGRREEGNSQVR